MVWRDGLRILGFLGEKRVGIVAAPSLELSEASLEQGWNFSPGNVEIGRDWDGMILKVLPSQTIPEFHEFHEFPCPFASTPHSSGRILLGMKKFPTFPALCFSFGVDFLPGSSLFPTFRIRREARKRWKLLNPNPAASCSIPGFSIPCLPVFNGISPSFGEDPEFPRQTRSSLVGIRRNHPRVPEIPKK